MQKKTNNSGITLIALIITIIVMLILVAVTINTAVQSGLFRYAKNATQGWADKETEESNIGNDNYIKDTVNKYSGKVDRSFLKVGDYVSYTPTTEANYKYTGLGTSTTETENPSGYKAGTDGNPTDGIPQDTTLTWRILSINDDGSVDIVSVKPTSQKVYFKNSIGYNNGVYLLNDLCASLYSNSTLSVTARSMNLIDVESKLNTNGIKARDDFKSSADIQYGHSKNYTNANVPDVYEHGGTSLLERSKPYYTVPTTTVTHTQKSHVDIEQTYYKFGDATPTDYFDDSTFYELVFGTGTSYWLASRYAYCSADIAYFSLRLVRSTRLSGNDLFYSSGSSNGDGYFARPVVTLRSDIQISVTGGTADNPRTLSK